jgi:hypothetical protein
MADVQNGTDASFRAAYRMREGVYLLAALSGNLWTAWVVHEGLHVKLDSDRVAV